MKTATLKLPSGAYLLYLNGESHFRLIDAFGSAYGETLFPDPMPADTAGTRDYVDHLLQAAAILSEQGEMVRRYLGYEAQPYLTDADMAGLWLILTPELLGKVASAVSAAIALGFDQSFTSSEDVDIGLLELEKKTPGQ